MPEVSCIGAVGAAPRIHCAHEHKMNTFVMSGRQCWRVTGSHLNELPHQSQISDTAESQREAWQSSVPCEPSRPRHLDAGEVSALRDWFDAHDEGSYPSIHERVALAQQTGIPETRVANRLTKERWRRKKESAGLTPPIEEARVVSDRSPGGRCPPTK